MYVSFRCWNGIQRNLYNTWHDTDSIPPPATPHPSTKKECLLYYYSKYLFWGGGGRMVVHLCCKTTIRVTSLRSSFWFDFMLYLGKVYMRLSFIQIIFYFR